MTVTTEHFYSGNNSTTSFAYTFPYYKTSDIKVKVGGTLKTESTHYNITGTNVVFTSGNVPPNGTNNIHIYRETDVDTSKATFAAGSSIRATDLNNNETQLLYHAQEQNFNKIQTADIEDKAITSDKILDGTIATADIADGAVTAAKLATNSIDATNLAANSVGASEIADNAVDTAAIADDAVTSAKIATGAVIADSIGTNAVTTAKIYNEAVETAKIDDGAVTTAKINNAAVTADKLGTDSVITAKILDANVTTNKIANDSVTTDKLENSINASIAANTAKTTNATHTGEVTGATSLTITNGAVVTDRIADDAVTAAKLANSINSEIAANTAKVTNASHTGEVTGSGALTIANAAVTTAKIADNAVTTEKIADAELSTLAGMPSATASILADSTALTSTTAELNLLDGKSIVTTISSPTDVQIPTAQAVDERIISVVTDVGGFRAIASETSFPTTNPDPEDNAGTIVSIKALTNAFTLGSGVTTKVFTDGAGSGNDVTITGLTASTTYPAGRGMLVETTSTLHTYTFHRLTLDETGVADAQTAISDFNQRYRTGASNPTSSLDDGDLFFNTSSNKMLVYNETGSSWDEVQSVGNFYINTISSYSGTGGNNATFNGSAYRFVLSNAPTYAQQLIVSVNGVLQKPNAGTSQPSEGFAIDGSSIIFSTAPASGADYFIITIGAAVNIGAPSDNQVSTASLQNSSVTTAKIADNAVTLAKMAGGTDGQIITYDASGNPVAVGPGTDGQVLTSTGAGSPPAFEDAASGVGGATGVDFNDDVKIRLGTGNDLEIYHNGTNSKIHNDTGSLLIETDGSEVEINKGTSENLAKFIPDGAVELYYDNVWKLKTASNGVHLNDSLFIPDSEKAHFGAGDDLQIWHDGSNSFIQKVTGGTGNLYIRAFDSANLVLESGNGSTGSELAIVCNGNGNVELYHSGTKKLETTSAGIEIYDHLDMDDNHAIRLGSDADLQIYHNGSHGYITEGTGNLKISAASGPVQILKGSSENIAAFTPDGSCELYYDNSKKLETTSTGITVTGKINPTGNIHMPDNVGIKIGASDDLVLWHYGTAGDDKNYISTNTRILRFQSDGDETLAEMTPNGAVELRYDNSTKLETRSDGVGINGILNMTSHIYLGDNDYLILGASNDLQIYHDGSHSYVKDSGTGNLKLIGGNVQMMNTAADEYMINAQSDGSVDLFHNGIKQLLTTSDGIEIKPDVEGSNAVLYLTADQGDDNLDKWAIKAASDGTIYHQSYTSGSFVTKFETRAGGDIKVNNGNILMGTAGTGINFSATSDGSGASNVNEILDDYEEGTFTPQIRSNTNTNGSADGSGYYVKIGRQVHIHVNIGNKTLTSIPAGTIRIDGLPFTANHNVADEFGLSTKMICMGVDSHAEDGYFITQSGQTYLLGYYNTNAAVWSAWNATAWDNSGVYVIFNMTYFTTS